METTTASILDYILSLLSHPVSGYFFLNFVMGLGFIIFYLNTEKKIQDIFEFLLLLFIPSLGYGNWYYNRGVRQNNEGIISRWHQIWSKMLIPHLFIVFFLVVLSLWILLWYTGYIGFGFESIEPSDNPSGIGGYLFLGLVYESFILLGGFIMFLIFIIIHGINIFFLLLIPKLIANSLANNFYSKQR